MGGEQLHVARNRRQAARREVAARKRIKSNIIRAAEGVLLVGALAFGGTAIYRHFQDALPNNPVPITESAGRVLRPPTHNAEAVRLNPSLETQYGDFQVTVEGAEQIGQEREQEAVEAAHLWHRVYTCNRPIVIAPLLDPQEKEYGPGVTAETIERAQPGRIFIGPRGSARNLTLHAMTHACKPDSPTYLQQPLQIGERFIVGYHGLEIVWSERGRGITRFGFIEEGMAERNASVFPGYNLDIQIPEFRVSTTYYSNVGQLTRNATPHEAHPDADDWVKTNNVPAFVRAYLRIPNNQPVTLEHLLQTVHPYEEAWVRGGGF